MNKTCRNCGKSYTVTESDKGFYKKIDVPEPTLCPTCRQQRRLAFRNERNLFKRTCDLCKKIIISLYDANINFPVYCTECWWSEKWDPFEYGRDFDFNRPFFPQFQELLSKVPKMSILQLNNENSDYNAMVAYSKNTYMSPGSYYMQDSYYARKSQYCRDCLNSNSLDHCELVSSSTNCQNCYNSHNLINCRSCSDSKYLTNCTSCQNCFMCSDIANKKFHYKNRPYSQKEYNKIIAEQLKRDPDELMSEFLEFTKSVPKKYQNQLNCENSSGDYIQNCKNAVECYDCFGIEDSKYITESVSVKDSMDLSMHDKDIERCYELCTGGESNSNLRFSFCSCASPNSDYLYSCFYLSDSFGCDSFHFKQKNCILNKKYSAEEYEKLKNRIIEHMKETKEYGEFFPIKLSLQPYNMSCAQDVFPLDRETVLKKGYQWKEQDPSQYQKATAKLPASIGEVPDSIIKEILACSTCGKNYRIIQQELTLSRRIKQPLSDLCGDCRQLKLIEFKNPRKLWDRTCAKCQKEIQSTYSPDRPENVYCEYCYRKEVY